MSQNLTQPEEIENVLRGMMWQDKDENLPDYLLDIDYLLNLISAASANENTVVNHHSHQPGELL